MILLDTTNGYLNIGDYDITSEMSLRDITTLKSKYDIELSVNNGDYISYRLPDFDGGEISFLFYFYKEKIYRLNIGVGINHALPAFEITNEKRKRIRNILATIGGEKSYDWGSVYYSEDIKGGSVSIGIKYN